MSDLSQLGTELVRIGSILRLHPENPAIAFQNSGLAIPLIEAAISKTPVFEEGYRRAHVRGLINT